MTDTDAEGISSIGPAPAEEERNNRTNNKLKPKNPFLQRLSRY